MTVLFAGTEPEAFNYKSGAVLFASTTPGREYDPDYSRGAIRVDTTLDSVGVDFPAQNEIWVQWRLRASSTVANASILRVQDSAGNNIAYVSSAGGPTYTLGYQTGASSGVSVAPATPSLGTAAGYFLTVHVKWLEVNKVFIEFFVDGVLISSATVTNAWIASKKPARVTFLTPGGGSSSSGYISEVIVTDTEDPRGWRVATLAPNSEGALGQWAGSYVDIDEIGVPDDNDFISSDTAGQVELFGLSNLSAPAQNMTPKAVFLASRARVGAGGPQNIKPGLRAGGSNFFQGPMPGLTPIFQNPLPAGWEVNPATSSPWTISDIQNLEAGFESVA